MESTAIHAAKQILFIVGIILLAGSFSGILAQKFKVPDVVVFLLIGIGLGPELAGVIDVRADSTINQLILIFGSSYILFDGGAGLRLKVLKEVWITIVIISTVGVLITTAIAGLAALQFLGMPLITALLLGSTIASTDPATLVPVFKQVRIKDRVAQTVMSESAFNDAMGAIVTFTIMGVALGTGGPFSLGAATFSLVSNALIGVLIGGVLGYAAAFLIAHEKFGFLLEYAPLVTLMAVVGAYMSAESMHASGFMAVFVFGIMLGNKDTFGFTMEEQEQEKLEDFVLTTSLIMRMFIFILLGSQVNFALIGKYLWGGIALVLVFMFIARPVTVFCCALPDRRTRWSLKEMLFMSWTRETGVIPGALAGMLLGMKVPGGEIIASVTFITILLTILIQATTTRWLAGKLGLLLDEPQIPLRSFNGNDLPTPE
ncbi:cation:proton antiporter [Geobacter argillaceus]|uniref:Sodium/proton antiporter, CPA1 family (TC 2.A.36) n=1 Tax=Geobacter argillaceus TaxID=345631 RepID=A0A562VIP3_9BACT|nr:cation:proton antiporter [Geobacter argillaceus]TWJ17785.1 sodium/proton antiporter, CPA1 family (TC 2.A.36) [Geobacter argillaceus]